MNKLSKHSSPETLTLTVGARDSPLSQAQVKEVLEEIRKHHPHITFQPLLVKTTGDHDRKTSLRTLDKTDFFTKDIDALLLNGKCRIAVHSAKDLPAPLPKGLRIAAVTQGVDCGDSLVLRSGETLESLPSGATIATSSARREDAVRSLRQDVRFIDLRGTIGERLAVLDAGVADCVVLAEAALIRLGLTHLNRIRLPGSTATGQGQLAVLVREGDAEMLVLFSCLDVRSTLLHVGLEAPQEDATRKVLHFPVIRIAPCNGDAPGVRAVLDNLSTFTHCVFTSKQGVHIFFDLARRFECDTLPLSRTVFAAVGKGTAQALGEKGYHASIVANHECAEGLVEELNKHDLQGCNVLWPHASQARPVLSEYFSQRSIPCTELLLYDTLPHRPGPLPADSAYDAILFTSPSTVDAFLELFQKFPGGKTLKAIGPVTAKHLTRVLLRFDRMTSQ